MKLEQQCVVVTGGASGMGRASVELLRARGAEVMVWDLQVESNDTHAIACDVRSAESVEAALLQTIERMGVPRVCLQCAGIAPAARMVGRKGVMPLDAFQKVIDVNLVGTFNVMRVLAEAMMKAPEALDGEEQGVMINTASIAAYEGQIGQTAYSASKGGIVSMTLPAARELAQYGIRVNTIAPGLIATPLLLNMPEEVQQSLADTVLFPKRLGKPEEFAALAVHIIENTFINGEVIRLDGALRMAPR
ncbi:MAG: SDR family oxidoreductase [Gammaproteobacteria bacterium]|nr:SDR family oxidoreductase [Gammaproteobacteria bacterium]